MAAEIRFNKKKSPLRAVQAVVAEPPMPSRAAPESTSMEEADEFLAALAQCQDGDEQVAVINRWKGKRDGGGHFMPTANVQR